MPDITGDGINDHDITAPGASVVIGGVTFTDAVNTGSGTGNYNTFLAISNNSGVEAGFNSDDTPPIDNSNDDIDHAKTHTVRLSDLVVVTIDGVQYYEFRVDLNEANSGINAQISLDQFKLYSSANGGIVDTTTLFAQNLIYDMDAGGNVSVLMSDASSSGSGTDDYAVLVPVSEFAGLDPTTTYVYLYAQMGAAGEGWEGNATFEEWNLQNGVTLTGTKFDDLDGDGIRDVGEGPVAGVTIFIDANQNGVFDAGERSTVTDASGNYTFHGVATGQTVWIDEVVPAGATQTTGSHEVVVIADGAAPGTSIVVDPIGNFIPRPDLTIVKSVLDVDGDGPGGSVNEAGDVISYRIAVTNSGNVVLTGLAVTDTLDPSVTAVDADADTFNDGDTDEDGVFDIGETWLFNASYTATQADIDGNGGGDGDIDNTATADSDQTDPENASASVPIVQNPDLTIVKTVLDVDGAGPGGSVDEAGDEIDYRISVTNSGNMTLTGLAVTDTLDPSVTAVDADADTFNDGDIDEDGVFDVGETWLFDASYTATQADIDGNGGGDGDIDNTATADTDQTGPENASASVPIVQNPDLTIVKTVLDVDGAGPGGSVDAAGDVIDYRISVTNSGNMTLTGLAVTDTLDPSVTAVDADADTFNDGDLDEDGVFDVGETWLFDASYTATQADIDGNGGGDGDIDNTATADTDQTDPENDSASVPIVRTPLVDLEKLVSVDSTNGTDGTFVDADTALGPENVNVGDPVWFKVTLENTGNVTLTDVDIVDNNTTTGLPGTFFDLVVDGALTQDAIDNHGATLVGDADADGQLDVGETWTITYSQAFDPGNHVNTAAVTTDEGAADDDAAHYFSLVNEGPGVRTPGFWQNPNNGGQFWDGIVGNEKNAGDPCFADGELLYAVDSNNDGVINASDQKGLLIGDYNGDGLTNVGEDTLFISYNDARSLINSSNKQLNMLSGDGKFMLGRDMVATWLNYLAGNNIGDASDTESPHHYLDDSIDWMQIFSGTTAGGTSETFDTLKLAGPAIKTSSAAWNSPQSGIDHSASQMHSALDYYNNTGQTEPGGTIYAHDCDDLHFVQAIHAVALV